MLDINLFTLNFRGVYLKKLIGKLLLIFCFIILLGAGCILFFFKNVAPQYSYAYSAVIWDKIERLKSINEPKIVLLGDSNVAFGFDSKLLEQETGMPVVNMGLQNGFGNAFLENLSKINVNEGDIYIICHDSFSDDGLFVDPSLVWITFENRTALYSLLTKEQLKQLPKAFPYYFRNALGLWINGQGNRDSGDAYSSLEFNEYGDNVYKREGTICSFEDQTVPEINDICVNRINELNDYLTSRWAALVVAAYPIPCENPDSVQYEYSIFRDELASKLDCEIISDYTSYLFPYSYFYDSGLHLNDNGRRIRTNLLLDDLQSLHIIPRKLK